MLLAFERETEMGMSITPIYAFGYDLGGAAQYDGYKVEHADEWDGNPFLYALEHADDYSGVLDELLGADNVDRLCVEQYGTHQEPGYILAMCQPTTGRLHSTVYAAPPTFTDSYHEHLGWALGKLDIRPQASVPTWLLAAHYSD